MKKIISILVFIQLLMISAFALNIFNTQKNYQLLYEDTTSILIKFENENSTKTDSIKFIQDLSNKYQVSISRYIFQNERDLVVYTTNPSLNGFVDLKSGTIPEIKSNQFISTLKSNDENQVGTIKKTELGFNITIKNLKKADNFGEDGIYYIRTANDLKIQQILSAINGAASAEILNQDNAFNLIEKPILLVSIGIVTLCILIALSYYLVEKLKVISILKISGFSSKRTTLYLIKDILRPLLFSSVLAYVMYMIYYGINHQFNYLHELSFLYLLYTIFILLVYILFVLICLYFILKKINLTASIKGRKPLTALTFANYGVKLIFIFFLLLSINQLLETSSKLESKLNNLSVWEKTQNLFTTRVAYTGQGSLGAEYDTNIKLKRYYADLEESHAGFLMEASNYVKLDGNFIYEMNAGDGDPSTSPNGKRVTINTNYLKYNPIKATNGAIEDQIKYDENILNILVPNKLKPLEQKINEQYKQYFYFQKVKVANMYRKELNKEAVTTTLEDLSINFIYVESNQDYFTFNPDYGEESGYLIRDPIAVIDTRNFDDSYYLSYLSSYFYFYSDSGTPYEDLYPLINKNNVQSSIQRVLSIYDLHGQEIKSLNQDKQMLTMIILILIMSSFIVTFNIIASHYQKNKMKLYVKKLFGYSSIRRNGLLLLLLILIDLVPTLISFALFDQSILLIMGFIIIVFEILLGITIEQMIAKKTFNSIIKGEH